MQQGIKDFLCGMNGVTDNNDFPNTLEIGSLVYITSYGK